MTNSSPSLTVAASRGLRVVAARHLRLIVPACVIGAVLVVIAPLPPVLMDLLLAANITLSVVILLTTIQVSNPLQFSVFPSLLLGTTLARLVLNIATTRLILTHAADQGTQAAGGVVAAFGGFVTSGSAAVGLILFVILVAIQFFVVTKGATRISEVAARFALDGMPGRQAAIDADLAAGAITAEEAQARRQSIARQADFYGAMDGASKFVRGDAVAGIVITLVNIIGGLAIGVVQHGMSLSEAAGVFTTLTIGDGLVSQLPAFLIAIAAGLLVTRTSLDSDLSRDVVGQTFAYPPVLYAAATMLAVLAFMGLPMGPLLCLAFGCALIAYSLDGAAEPTHSEPTHSEPTHSEPTQSGPPRSETGRETPASAANGNAPAGGMLFTPGETEPLTLELGLGLLSLAKDAGDGGIVRMIAVLRQRLALELGYVVPKVRIRDNLMLGFREFRVTLDGVGIATGQVEEDAPAGDAVILTRLEAVVRDHSHELLSRQQVHQLLDHLRQHSPRLVDDVVPEPLKPGHVHHVLASLLREQVSIRNLETILGTLADAAHETHDVEQLTEAVRRSLARTICRPHCRGDGTLSVITLDPLFEAALAEGFADRSDAALVDTLAAALAAIPDGPTRPVLVCRADLRPTLRRAIEKPFPELAVLSRHEITPDIKLHVVAEIGQSLLTSGAALAAVA